MGLMTNPVPNRFRTSPKTNDQRMFLKTRQIFRIHQQTASRRNHQVLVIPQFLHQFRFQAPEYRFAVARKYLCNTLPRPFLDPRVGINKLKSQHFGHYLSDSAFACSHETSQRNISKIPHVWAILRQKPGSTI